MQCTKMKTNTDAYYPCKINKTNNFSPILVTTLDKVYRATTVDTELRRWSIMSHDGGYQATTVEYHEPQQWIPSHDGGVS